MAKATRAAFGPTLLELVDEGIDVMAVDADLAGSTTTAKILSVYDIVNAEKLVIDQKALAIIEEVFA